MNEIGGYDSEGAKPGFRLNERLPGYHHRP
jgi:hypothetical protein